MKCKFFPDVFMNLPAIQVHFTSSLLQGPAEHSIIVTL